MGRLGWGTRLYACATCNEAKNDIMGIPNPCEVTFRDCIRILPDGHIEALNNSGEKLRQALQLDSERNVSYRYRWMRTIEALRTEEPDLYQEYMGFPDDLPDLRRKRVPSNTKPDGAADCYFALRERGVLPAMY